METIEQLGELFLGTRLKRLSDLLFDEVDNVYQQQNIDLTSRTTALLFLLHQEKNASITQLADCLGISHPAVHQMSKKLLSQGYVATQPDPKDERRRILSLSPGGRALVTRLEPIWQCLRIQLDKMLTSGDHDLLRAVSHLEHACKLRPLSQRIEQQLSEQHSRNVKIVCYRPEYKADFKRLNIEWLEKYFYVEAIDDQVLSNPDTFILNKGGEILFAKLGEEIVGTVALMLDEDGRVELTKMAVTEKYQGLKIGRKLLDAAIQRFKKSGRKQLFLESNSRLTTAIGLYEKVGFVHKPKLDNSHYQRADVYMVFED
jgi:DNA-binding MarR family transcriptional regulator/GNAT superfamily N-acetyltransferase